MTDSRYDIIVFGATSFVGQIVCRYLTKEYQDPSLRWAAAGRSETRLRALQQELGADDTSMPILLANADDPGSLQALCHQCDVIISTVGPYALFGEPMVKACVESGTDYCDLTGETPRIQQMVARYQSLAEKTGARIVHCCGFDSIPSDLGVYFLQQQSKSRYGEYCSTVKMRVKAMRGGFSGGLGGFSFFGFLGFALLGLLAGLGFLRVVAVLPLDHASGPEEAGDAIGRLRALADPFLGLFEVEDDALLVVFRQQRIVGADLLDEAAVAGIARVGNDDAVVRTLFRAATGEPDFQGHVLSLSGFQFGLISDLGWRHPGGAHRNPGSGRMQEHATVSGSRIALRASGMTKGVWKVIFLPAVSHDDGSPPSR